MMLNGYAVNGRALNGAAASDPLWRGRRRQINGWAVNGTPVLGASYNIVSGETTSALVNRRTINMGAINGGAGVQLAITQPDARRNRRLVNGTVLNLGAVNGGVFSDEQSGPQAVSVSFSYVIDFAYTLQGNSTFSHWIEYDVFASRDNYGIVVKYDLRQLADFSHVVRYDLRERKGFSWFAEYELLLYDPFWTNYQTEYEVRGAVGAFASSFASHIVRSRYLQVGGFYTNHVIEYDVFASRDNYGFVVDYSIYTSFWFGAQYAIRSTAEFSHVVKLKLLSHDPVRASFKTSWSLRFAASFVADYRIRGSVEGTNRQSFDAVYELRGAVGDNAANVQSFSVGYEIAGAVSASAGNIQAHEVQYEIRSAVGAFAESVAAHVSAYEIRSAVADTAISVASFELAYTVRGLKQASFMARHAMTSALAVGHDVRYELQTNAKVTSGYRARYRMAASALVEITGQPKITFTDPENEAVVYEVDILTAHVFKSADVVHWACEIAIAHPSDFIRFRRDQAFTLDLFGELYSFIVDSKEMTRAIGQNGNVQIAMTLSGVSPTAMLDSPRVLPVELATNESSVDVQDYVETTLLPTASIDWGILTWQLPKHRIGAGRTIPLSYARVLVEVVGGVLEATKDGNLRVRKAWKERPEDMILLKEAVADIVLTEADSLFSISEQYVPQRTIDKYRILDVEEFYQDVVEATIHDDNPLAADVFVYPTPWRTSVALHATSPSSRARLVQIGGVHTRQVTGDGRGELVEVINSEASVSYPVWAIDEVTWISNALGSVTFEPGSTIIRTTDSSNGYGYLYVKYTTKFLKYLLTASREGDGSVFPAQVILEDL
jgi:hypothetical protein